MSEFLVKQRLLNWLIEERDHYENLYQLFDDKFMLERQVAVDIILANINYGRFDWSGEGD